MSPQKLEGFGDGRHRSCGSLQRGAQCFTGKFCNTVLFILELLDKFVDFVLNFLILLALNGEARETGETVPSATPA